jgi:hypothetical protein
MTLRSAVGKAYDFVAHHYQLEDYVKNGLVVGENFYMYAEVMIDHAPAWHVEIGDDVTLAPRVQIWRTTRACFRIWATRPRRSRSATGVRGSRPTPCWSDRRRRHRHRSGRGLTTSPTGKSSPETAEVVHDGGYLAGAPR